MAEAIDEVTIREKAVLDGSTAYIEVKQNERHIKRYSTMYGPMNRIDIVLKDEVPYQIDGTKYLMIATNKPVMVRASKEDDSVIEFEVAKVFMTDEALHSITITNPGEDVVRLAVVY